MPGFLLARANVGDYSLTQLPILVRPWGSPVVRKRLGIVAVVVVGLAAVAGALTGRAYFRHAQPAPPSNPEQPALTINPAHLDFGEVWETSQFLWSVPIRNTSSQPVVIERWQASCDCSDVQPSSMRLEPGETKAISVRIDLGRNLGATSGTPVSVSLSPLFGGKSLATWALRGSVKPLIRPSAIPTAAFSNEMTARRQQVELELVAPVHTVVATCRAPHVRCELSHRAELRKITLILSYADDLSDGLHSFGIELRGQLTTGDPFSKHLTGAVTVRPEIEVSPPSLVVSGPSTGMWEETIGFRSRSDIPLLLVGAESKAATGQSLVSVRTISPDQLSITVQKPPAERGVVRETVVAYLLVGWSLRVAFCEITITP